MRRGVVAWVGCAILLAGLSAAQAGHDLSDEDMRAEMMRNRAMAAYIDWNGMPDVAERHFLSDRPPWDEYEVRLYYLNLRREIAFARAYILGRPELSMERSQRPLSDEDVAALEKRARQRRTMTAGDAPAGDAPLAPLLNPADRAEEAARRAELAASRVEAAADATERAADRTEAVVAKMEVAPARRTTRRTK